MDIRNSVQRGCVGLLSVASVLLAAPGAFAQHRSIDGAGNNLSNPDFGSVGEALVRLGPVSYADGISSPPRGAPLLNPRRISRIVCAQGEVDIPSSVGASGFLFQWGQFLDHDMDLTPPAVPTDAFSITVPAGDLEFTPGASIPLRRSLFEGGSGVSDPREQLNEITAFIDASNVYGSDATRAAALRTNDGRGTLKTSRFDLLPFNTAGLPNEDGSDPTLYLAGDVRANEQVGLTAMHTLFVREHNRLATEIAKSDRRLSGEQVYQQARARVGAILQAITYNQFLPLLLGRGALPPYEGYDPDVDSGISNEFATAAFRFGHSTISPVLHRLKRNGQSIPAGPLSLRDAFFTRDELNPNVGKGIEPLLRGLALVPSQEVDLLIVDDVRNFLFGNPAAGGVDLAALNIQRGRDHGLPSYVQMRLALGLPAPASFGDVSSNSSVVARLATAYPAVGDLDLWVGGLAEDKLGGSLVGPTFHAILVDQFTRLRDGDRFWYEIKFSGSELAELQATTLTDVIVRNTKILPGDLPANPFFTP